MNIIVIIADDLGFGDVGYKNADAITPNIDKLALEGTRLENFYVQSSCSPTRAALMTGNFCYRLGMQRVIWPWNTNSIDPNIKFLPQYLKEAGYKTKMFGKWNLGHTDLRYIPINRGFDYHYGSYFGCMDHYAHSYYGIHDLVENNKAVYDQGHIADLLTNKVCEHLKTETNPFFYYVAFNSPHEPLQYPTQYLDKYGKLQDRKRASLLAMVTHLDDCIGKILTSLEQNNLRDDTLIWFSTDNGGFIPAGSNNGQLKGGKVTNYEGGLKAINFINYKPWNHGRVNNGLYHAVDFVPTLAKLAGVQSESLDGIDISENIINAQEPKERTLVFDAMISGINKNAVYGVIRKNNYKIHIAGNSVELYDIENDASETNNLALKNDLKNSLVITEAYNFIKSLEKDYVKDPQTWWKPNGHPTSWTAPLTSCCEDRMIPLSHEPILPYVDTEEFCTDSVKDILGYYNLP